MSVILLKQTVKHLKSREKIFSEEIKRILPHTNLNILGEELLLQPRGQCDLWLANEYKGHVNFLLSLELKVGSENDNTKKHKLMKQVDVYTKAMQKYFPAYPVYGLGAYKVNQGDKVLWFGNDHNVESLIQFKNLVECAIN